ncbi:MAG: hypothetical protein IPH66_03115 [Crocinitomicaceae bacterium]|nr:hypothetical protein [Crocinitomicaceae bacterium]
MRILFTGLPYFGKNLVSDLNRIDPDNQYIFCDTYYSISGKIKFALLVRFADRVVSFNGASSKSKALDLALKYKKKLIMQWHGSDVLTLQSGIKNGTVEKKYIEHAVSATDASWLQHELIEAGVKASLHPFKYVEAGSSGASFKSKSVLSYLGEGQEKFYGIDYILELAVKYPDIHFHLTGTKGNAVNAPTNVHFYGWVSKAVMQSLLNEHPIYLRLTEHDGYSLSVMEAIANGNYVIWNQPHVRVFVAKNSDELINIFQQVLLSFDQNQGARLDENITWAKEHLDKTKILQAYSQFLKTC